MNKNYEKKNEMKMNLKQEDHDGPGVAHLSFLNYEV